MKLKGKVAIVTGAGRGIGRATALAFAREGADIVVVAKTKSQLEKVAEECRGLGVKAISVPTDVSKKDQVTAMVKIAFETFGKVDFLINNAGVAVHNLIPDIREEDFDLNYFVNAKGVFLCTQAVFSRMCEQRSGHIINVASGAGKRGGMRMGAYAASKFAAVGFTQTTDVEGRPHGVKASVVCPGPVDTQLRRGNHPGDILENLTTPEEIADGILYLACQPSRAYTQELIINTPLQVKKG